MLDWQKDSTRIMILPHPETDLNLNIMVVGTDIVSILDKHKGYMLVEDVMNEFIKKDQRRTPDLFLYTLMFLFSFGLIEKKNFRIRLNKHVSNTPMLF